MHAQLCADNHQGISHIVAGISHICQLHALDPAKLFFNGQHICQHLGWMELIGETVPHRNARILSKLLHDLLTVAAIFDTFIHTAEHSRRIGDTLLLADLGSGRIEIRGSDSKIMGCHFKGASCSGAGLFKDQCHVFTLMHILCENALFLFVL